MKNKQGQIASSESSTTSKREEAYTLSALRIAEGVIINITSAAILAISLSVLSAIFHFLIIPIYWLEIIAIFGITLLVVAGLFYLILYLYVKKHPWIFVGILVSMIAERYMENNRGKFNFPEFTFTQDDQGKQAGVKDEQKEAP